MINISTKTLDILIENCRKFDIIPTKILIGYKAYADLMKDPKFSEEVTYSALTPNKRKYKKIKIKITHSEYQLEVV